MKQLRFLLNPLLLIILLGILTIPFVVSESVVQPTKDAGIVAGFRTITNKDLTIYPNFSDFDGYVTFTPSQIINGRFSDQLTLTSFRGQIAIYHRLYTIFNDSNSPVALRLVLNQPPLSSSFGSLILSLHLGNEPTCTSAETTCHLQEIFIRNGEILNREGRIVTVAPGASARITATITGLSDYSTSTSSVTVDVSLLANFAE